jgi:hypothetical protein
MIVTSEELFTVDSGAQISATVAKGWHGDEPATFNVTLQIATPSPLNRVRAPQS